MNTVQYLNQLSMMKSIIKTKRMEISDLKEMIYCISSPNYKEKVQTTPNFDKIGSYIAKIDERERELLLSVNQYVEKAKEIENQIEEMDSKNDYEVLSLRYIGCMGFEEISKRMNYSRRQITRIHQKAIKNFEKKYGHLYKMS